MGNATPTRKECIKNEKNTLEDKVFVITGSLEHYNNRDELIEYIESLGGKVISAVSPKVNYLINNDVNSNKEPSQIDEAPEVIPPKEDKKSGKIEETGLTAIGVAYQCHRYLLA